MATLNRGILGGIKGKIGNVVGSSWKGIATLKSLPLSVANPRTAGQVAQRTKMTAVVLVGQLLASTTIETFFQRLAVKMSGFNLFVKTNIAAFTDLGVLIPASFKTSYGKLLGFTPIILQADESSNSVYCTWDDNSGTGNAISSDTASFVWYNATQDYWMSPSTSIDRNQESVTYEDTRLVAGDVVEIYISVRRADFSLFSNSLHQTVTVQA